MTTQRIGLRDAAERIYRSALAAVEPGRLVCSAVQRDGASLVVRDRTLDLDAFDHIYVISFGKAAVPMAAALAEILGERLTEGLTVEPAVGEAGPSAAAPATAYGGRIRTLAASHPLPDERSVAAGRAVLELAGRAGARNLVFVCVSGGGSALLSVPAPGLTIEDKRAVTSRLLAVGATIGEINAVRKHLSAIKGGRLAAALAPATFVSLVISDVVGNDPATIASGPTAGDGSTFAAAKAVLEKYELWSAAPPAVRARIDAGLDGRAAETVRPDDSVFSHASYFIIGDNLAALEAARVEAENLGFESLILTSADEGEARDTARRYLAFLETFLCSLAQPLCFLAGGELTVTVRGRGQGGRNMEFVLAAVAEMERGGASAALAQPCREKSDEACAFGRPAPDWLILSLGTDGRDGTTDAAGAWAGPAVVAEARRLALRPEDFLNENDSFGYFSRAGGVITTGPTGTNVMDLRLFLLQP
ncbi:MAG: DUF4147 domain-containing protein [Candidatus Aminicenantes bacterium]|nr:DUF4147 domain-containing protein [Candidatus Aminicenantes bacterium]